MLIDGRVLSILSVLGSCLLAPGGTQNIDFVDYCCLCSDCWLNGQDWPKRPCRMNE